jgi:hypothetical protein
MRNLEGPAVILFDTRKRKENTQKMLLCCFCSGRKKEKKKKTIGITPVGDISSSSMGGGRLSKY